jgi:hypothetical protein
LTIFAKPHAFIKIKANEDTFVDFYAKSWWTVDFAEVGTDVTHFVAFAGTTVALAANHVGTATKQDIK